MKSDTVLEGLESLSKAGLVRTPAKFGEVAELWFRKFKNMSDSQFICAVDAIIDNETAWPSISIIYKYASTSAESRKGKKRYACPCCEDTGFLLIKSKNKDIAYACRCEEGQKKRENFGIMAYDFLGIPWPVIEKPNFSKKMSMKNRQLIDNFLGRIGQEMPEKGPQEDELWNVMESGGLELR